MGEDTCRGEIQIMTDFEYKIGRAAYEAYRECRERDGIETLDAFEEISGERQRRWVEVARAVLECMAVFA